jgi:serine/threonine-protein kinase
VFLLARLYYRERKRRLAAEEVLDKTVYLGPWGLPQVDGRGKIGKYDIASEIARGAMGVILLGNDPYIKRKVAIKIVNPLKAEGSEGSNAYKARLFTEAQAAGNLFHPGIVTIYDANEVDDLCFIVMDYISGKTLEDMCSQKEPVALEKIVQVGIKICHALDYAHQRQVIHRDIKPSNIMISDEGEVKITDFGIAYIPSSREFKEDTIVGTPYYLSPEQITGEQVRASSDLFSLGIVLYELITGRRPFEGEEIDDIFRGILNEEPLPASAFRPDVPESLEKVVSMALMKDIEERYQDGIAFARDLENSLKADDSLNLEPSLRKKAEQLSNLLFFKEFSNPEIEAFLRIGTWMVFNEKDTIIHEDEKDTSFYIIVSGTVRVETGGKPLAVLHRGDCFGELAFLRGKKRVASVIAQQDCQLLKLSEVKIPLLAVEVQLRVYQSFAKILAEKLVQMDKMYLGIS